MLARSTRTAGVRRSGIRSVCLTRVALIRVAVDASVIITSSSRLQQSGTMNFAGWTSCHVTELFKVCFTDVDAAGSSVVTVIRFGRSGVDVWQLWDDQHWLRQICRNVAWVRLPRAFHGHSAAICGHITALLGLVSWIEQHVSCKGLVHDNALRCFYSNTHERTHLLTTSTPTCVECAFGSRRTHHSSATPQG